MAATLPGSSSRNAAADVDPFTTKRASLTLERSEVSRSAGGNPRFVISTEDIDLEGDVVVQAGLEPIATRIPAQVDHSGRMRDLIGWWDNIKTEGKKTLADLVLLPPGTSDVADLVRALHDAGIRMAASIGFTLQRDKHGSYDASYELLRDGQNDWVTGIKYLKTNLIEASVVVVPANPGALSVRALDIGKRFGLDAHRYHTFVMSEASQQLLRGMPAADAKARAAAAVQKATALLERGVRK